MRIVVALGGNALLKRGEPMTTEAQRANLLATEAGLAEVSLSSNSDDTDYFLIFLMIRSAWLRAISGMCSSVLSS